MVEQLEGVLDALATRFGATGEYLWEILVRQQIVEGIIGICATVVFVVVVSILGFLQWHHDEDFGYDPFPYTVPLSICIILLTIFGLTMMLVGIPQLLNPEYYALKAILPMMP